MRIWFDMITPKHLLFLEPMAARLEGVLRTTRRYGEVSPLLKIRGVRAVEAGRHGGSSREGKLGAGLERMALLVKAVKRFSPDLSVACSSPEAARVAYGLGIPHVSFADSPHAEAVMRLTVPLAGRLLTPWIFPRSEFARFGIDPDKIIRYRSIDAAVTARREPAGPPVPFDRDRPTILVRAEEGQAAYAKGGGRTVPIIRALLDKHKDKEVAILARYPVQRRELRAAFGNRIRIMGMSHDGRRLLDGCDVFVGSGGTMTAEAALLGVPTVSYDAVPNAVEKYLVRRGLARRGRTPGSVASMINGMIRSRKKTARKAGVELARMEDPFYTLEKAARALGTKLDVRAST
ncbi:uncharacterized protein conserved in archaea [Cenarchaeum symbiosum A]|uniref:Uncharacterized protein conserved in archaea n=1 Tax=Cenarchaeum symbiosum (strain A) TaxID=414004 RepID=A0RYZ8_CENSY|nr:uncharacterized protein conserved in archaea [Cenarchaeum symbiosum A]